MASFKDKHGRKYDIVLTDTIVAKIRRILGIDLRDRADVAALANDAETHINAIYLACQTQADEFGITAAEFGESLGSDSAIVGATKALIRECSRIANRRRR